MSRHDIRLRRQAFSSQFSSRHKNYEEILERHKKSNRIRIYMHLLLVVLMISILIGITYFTVIPKKVKEAKENKIENTR